MESYFWGDYMCEETIINVNDVDYVLSNVKFNDDVLQMNVKRTDNKDVTEDELAILEDTISLFFEGIVKEDI